MKLHTLYKGTLSGVLFALIVEKIPLSNFFYTSTATDASDKYQVCDDDHAMITLQMEQMGFWWGVHWTNQFLGDGVTRDREQGPGRETGREKGKFLERKIQQFIQIGIK